MDSWEFGGTYNGGHPISDTPPPGKDDDWTDFENAITEALNNTLNLNHASTANVIAEPWNEPDGNSFWPYTGQYSYKNHFVDTWEHAYNTIKNVDPNLKVAGPTFLSQHWDKNPHKPAATMKEFLNQANDRSVFPDIIDWHYPYANLVEQVKNVKQYLNKKDKYIDGIIISEHISPGNRKDGDSAYAIAEIERVSEYMEHGAYMLTSMLDPTPKNNGQLNGLTTKDYGKRGAWWIYKKYADMNKGSDGLGTLVLKTDRGEQVECYATADVDDPNVHILLGTWGTKYYSIATHNTTINLHDFHYFFKPNTYVYADVYKLDSNGDDPVGEPYNVGTFELTLREGEVSSFIMSWGAEPEACYYINIHPV